MTVISKFLATMFGVGYLPKAPGTWGSLAAVLLWYSFPLPENPVLFLALTIIVSISGIIVSGYTEKTTGLHDPSIVVIDEWAGQWIALLFLERSIPLAFIAFLLFRIFDIWKPGPIKWADSKRGGLGIMGDDIIAGFIVLLFMQVIKIWL